MFPRPPIAYPDRPFHHFLEDAAELEPEDVALRVGDTEVTFRELDGCANAFARALAELGVSVGDRVALRLANSVEHVVALFAVSKLGAASVLLNPRWTDDELAAAAEVASPRALICHEHRSQDSDRYDILVAVAAREPGHDFWELVRSHTGGRFRADVFDWAELPAVLPFSSGTTGLPKAAIHTHRTIVPATLQWKAAGLMRSTDRMLLFLPLFHVYGVITLAGAIAARSSMRLMPRFDAVRVLRCIEAEQITMTFGAAPVALAISDLPDLETYDLASLRYFVWGATPMDERLAKEVTRRSGIKWLHAYGATEAPLLHCNPVAYPERWRLDSPGIPVSDVQVKTVDLVTREELAPGRAGELLVKGPQVFRGYLPETASCEAFEDGWLRTGDIGWVEPDGWIHVVDRAKEMIKVNAFQVAPVELERVLLSHPDISDAGVFGMPDPRTGEAPVAAVVRRDAAVITEDGLVEWIGNQVASYKRIKRIFFITEVPRTTSGKILRRVLRDQYSRSQHLQPTDPPHQQ